MRGEVMKTSPRLQPVGALRGGDALRGDARWHNGSTIAIGTGGDSTTDGGLVAQLL